MTKFLIAAAMIVQAHPALAQPKSPISLINAESSDGFADLGECEAVLNGSARSVETAGAGRDARVTPPGSIINRARGHVSRCAKVDGEFLIVVYPAVSQASPGA